MERRSSAARARRGREAAREAAGDADPEGLPRADPRGSRAAILGSSVGTVKANLFHALGTCRKLWMQEGDEPDAGPSVRRSADGGCSRARRARPRGGTSRAAPMPRARRTARARGSRWRGRAECRSPRPLLGGVPATGRPPHRGRACRSASRGVSRPALGRGGRARRRSSALRQGAARAALRRVALPAWSPLPPAEDDLGFACWKVSSRRRTIGGRRLRAASPSALPDCRTRRAWPLAGALRGERRRDGAVRRHLVACIACWPQRCSAQPRPPRRRPRRSRPSPACSARRGLQDDRRLHHEQPAGEPGPDGRAVREAAAARQEAADRSARRGRTSATARAATRCGGCCAAGSATEAQVAELLRELKAVEAEEPAAHRCGTSRRSTPSLNPSSRRSSGCWRSRSSGRSAS